MAEFKVNLKTRTNNALVQTFLVDTLNQLTNMSRSGTLTVAWSTTSPATNVTVNTSSATLYADATFASANHSPVDGTNSYTAIAQDGYGRSDTNSITVWLPASVNFTYDLERGHPLRRRVNGKKLSVPYFSLSGSPTRRATAWTTLIRACVFVARFQIDRVPRAIRPATPLVPASRALRPPSS